MARPASKSKAKHFDSPPPGQTGGATNRRFWLVTIALAIFTFALFSPVRHFDFVNLDDPDYVVENPIVQQGLTMAGIKWAFTSAHAFNWHPLTWISHMIDCQWFGPNAGRHHLVNVLFHVLNTVLLCLVFWRATRALWPSVFVGAVFALHPLHVESVAWVCERKDVLSTFFWLLTMLFYVQYAQCKKVLAYVLALGSFALGLMSKPMLVTLPCVLLLMDYWPLRRLSRRVLVEKIPFFALTILSSVITFLVQRSQGAVADTTTFPIGVRIGNVFVSYVRYLAKTVWPSDLVVFYPYPEAWPLSSVLGAAAILALITFMAVRLARRAPYLAAGWFWFLGTLVPVIGLVQVGLQSIADRYMYVPMIGLSFALAWAATELASGAIRKIFPALGGLAIVACAIVTHSQLLHWRDSGTLFSHAIRVHPDHVIARLMLGNYYLSQGRQDEAIGCYQQLLERNPNFAEARYNLANIYVGQNKLNEAIEQYEKAIAMRPDYTDARANFAVVLGMARRFNEAFAQYEVVLKERPNEPQVLRNMALDLATLGRFDEASVKITQAMQNSPPDPALHLIFGDILVRQGKRTEARAQFNAALEINPGFAAARQRLAAMNSN